MTLVKASLRLFGGDTVVVHCSEKSHIHLMSAHGRPELEQANSQSVENRRSAYLTVPYSGTWNILIESQCQSLEHAISYVPA